MVIIYIVGFSEGVCGSLLLSVNIGTEFETDQAAELLVICFLIVTAGFVDDRNAQASVKTNMTR